MIKDKLRSLYYKLKHFFYSYICPTVSILARYVISVIVMLSLGFMLEQSGVIIDDKLNKSIKFIAFIFNMWVMIPFVTFNINLIEDVLNLFGKRK